MSPTPHYFLMICPNRKLESLTFSEEWNTLHTSVWYKHLHCLHCIDLMLGKLLIGNWCSSHPQLKNYGGLLVGSLRPNCLQHEGQSFYNISLDLSNRARMINLNYIRWKLPTEAFTGLWRQLMAKTELCLVIILAWDLSCSDADLLCLFIQLSSKFSHHSLPLKTKRYGNTSLSPTRQGSISQSKDEWHWAPTASTSSKLACDWIRHIVAGLENLAHWTRENTTIESRHSLSFTTDTYCLYPKIPMTEQWLLRISTP